MAHAAHNERPMFRPSPTAVAIPAPRRNIIEANETFLAVTTGRRYADKRWITETPFFGALDIADLLNELTDDDIIMIRRLNVETWVSEDITEEVARQYLYAMDEKEGIELGDERDFPAYVRNSRAWALWKDDIEASRPVEDADTFNAMRREIPALTTARRPDMSRKSRAEAV